MDLSQENGVDALIGKLQYAKKLGYKLIYTAHNIVSHDSVNIKRELSFRRRAAEYFDHVIVHGELATE